MCLLLLLAVCLFEAPTESAQQKRSQTYISSHQSTDQRAVPEFDTPSNALAPSGQLPREPNTRHNPHPKTLVKPPSTPREAFINVDDNELRVLFDEDTITPDDPTLLRILYRLPLVGLDNIQRYAQQTQDVKWEEVVARPASHQLGIFRLQGRVRQIVQHNIPPKDAELLEFTHYYRVVFDLDDSLASVSVISLNVPADWKTGEPIDERSSCFGLLINANSGDKERSPARLVFVTQRIAWHPDRENQDAGVGPGHILLGQLGMDVGLFDNLRRLNKAGLDSNADAECFFHLLAAVGRVEPNVLSRHAPDRFDLASLLLGPQMQHGKLMTVQGSARRITRIDIEDSYFRDRLGLDHYYQIDIFVPLGKKTVKLGNAHFINDFPVTVCVRQLPDDLHPADEMNETVRVACFFFKLWSYKSQFMRSFGGRQNQLSPMLVGLAPSRIYYRPTASPYASVVGVSVVVLAMGGIWLGLWLYSRGDKKFEQEQLRSRHEVEKNQSLDNLGIDADDKPDFSGLD